MHRHVLVGLTLAVGTVLSSASASACGCRDGSVYSYYAPAPAYGYYPPAPIYGYAPPPAYGFYPTAPVYGYAPPPAYGYYPPVPVYGYTRSYDYRLPVYRYRDVGWRRW